MKRPTLSDVPRPALVLGFAGLIPFVAGAIGAWTLEADRALPGIMADDPRRADRAAALLALVGAINVPIIYFSVQWWNTLHQGASVFRAGGPTLDRTFLIPLLVMGVAFALLFVTLHLAAMRNEVLRRRVRTLQMMQASRQAA